MADNYRRWAEALAKDGDFESEKDKLQKAVKFCKVALEIDNNDSKTNDLYRKILFQIAHHIKRNDGELKSIKAFKKFIVKSPKRWQEIKYVALASKELIKIYVSQNMPSEANELLTSVCPCRHNILI